MNPGNERPIPPTASPLLSPLLSGDGHNGRHSNLATQHITFADLSAPERSSETTALWSGVVRRSYTVGQGLCRGRHLQGSTSDAQQGARVPRAFSATSLRHLERLATARRRRLHQDPHFLLGAVTPPAASLFAHYGRALSEPRSEAASVTSRSRDTSTAQGSILRRDASSVLAVIEEDPMEVFDPEEPELSGWQLFRLTICLLGLQFTWTVELAYGTPYLLSLGMSKSSTSLVWIVGPLSGLIVQPLVGAYSDRCVARLGRRRPFIIAGTVAVILSLVVLAFARQLATPFASSQSGLAITIAIAAFYIMDFSINMVQGSCRALISDIAPLRQQKHASAYAAAMIGMGSVIGYLVGFLDLPSLVKLNGHSGQMEILCIMAAALFGTCVAITSLSTHEHPASAASFAEEDMTAFQIFKDIFSALRRLPGKVSQVCRVQFFAWVGWFPVLFYCTTWVAQYVADSHHPFDGPDNEAAARSGSLALLVFSAVAFLTSVTLPWLYSKQRAMTMVHIWTMSHVLFAVVAWLTLGVFDGTGAMVVLGLFGVVWGVAGWAPWALLGEYVAQVEAETPAGKGYEVDRMDPSAAHKHGLAGSGDVAESIAHAGAESSDSDALVSPETPKLSSGMIFGIHNIFIVLPQFLASLIAGLFFHYLEAAPHDGDGIPDRKDDDHMVPGDAKDAIGWVIRFGGLCALMAAAASTRVKEIVPAGAEQAGAGRYSRVLEAEQ